MRDTDAAAELSARVHVRARSIAWSLLVVGLVGACFALVFAPPRGARFEAQLNWTVAPPEAQDWPRPAREGERVRVVPGEHGAVLVVTGADAAGTRSLARAFAGLQAPGAAALHEALARVRQEWQAELSNIPPPRRTAPADCASLLFARAIWGRTLGDRLPLPSPIKPPPPVTAPDAVVAAWRDVRLAAEAGRSAPLVTALTDATARETSWFADASAWQGWTAPARAEAWRRWQDERADELETLADWLLAKQEPLMRRAAELAAHPHMVELDAQLSDPWQPLASPDPATLRPLVRPIGRVWLPTLLWGASIGGMLALLATLGLALLRARLLRDEAERWGAHAADPAVAGPRLHVVTGPTAAAVTRAALELAARRIALGERVLLVDGSAKLGLHERLGRDARWGLLECLAAEMPVLGLVQYAGHPGLYLLAHGNAERAVGWSQLGRKLDEVVPHFGRIVLALDPQAPAELGDALRGVAMEGWWGVLAGHVGKNAEHATARLGIVFHSLDLSGIPEPSLEALGARVLVLRPAGPVPEPAPITAHALRPGPELPKPALEPIVLDCDLLVVERMRFLVWMHRLQAEHREDIAVRVPS